MVQMHWQVQPSFLEGQFPGRQWVLLGKTCCGGRESAPVPFEGSTPPPPNLAIGSALIAALTLVLWFWHQCLGESEHLLGQWFAGLFQSLLSCLGPGIL